MSQTREFIAQRAKELDDLWQHIAQSVESQELTEAERAELDARLDDPDNLAHGTEWEARPTAVSCAMIARVIVSQAALGDLRDI